MAPRLPRGTKPKSNALKTRKTVFEKRLPMVKKKAHELSVLCDISVALICYDTENKLHVYPEDKLESVRQLLVKFVGLSDEKREKHASDLKDFLPCLNSKKKNPITAIEQSPIDVESMSSEEFWAMISSMDSKFDGWKEKLDRSKNSEVEFNLKETPEGFSDQLGFGLIDELNYLECGSTMFDQSQSVSNLGDSVIDKCNFGVPNNDQFLSDEFCMKKNPYQLLNPNPTPIMYNLGVLGNDQCLSDDSYLTNNPYQLLNPNLTPIMYNLGVLGNDQFLSDDSYLTNNAYQLSNPNLIPTPISYNLGVSGHDQVTETNYQMWDPIPTQLSYNLGILGHDQVTETDYQLRDPNPAPISYDQVRVVDSFVVTEPYQTADLNPTPMTSSLEEVSGQHKLMGVDSFPMSEGCEMRDVCLMAETNVWEGGFLEDGDCLLRAEDMDMSELLCGDMN